jgi:putative ABC transport system permease protein
MFKNYFLIALRNVKRHKVYSFINIIGLAIGMAICILIWHFISYENSYDDFCENGKNLYRMELAIYKNGKLIGNNSKAPPALGPAVKANFPEVSEYARLYCYNSGVVTYKNVSARVEDLFLADGSFLNMLSIPLVEGNSETALAEPFSAVISESAAQKFFGDEDPMGKVIEFDRIGHWVYTITGVFKDIPHNSHLQFDFLFSLHYVLDLPHFKKEPWKSFNFFTYVLLHPNTNPKVLEDKIPKFLDKYVGEAASKYKVKGVYSLQPISMIYLHSPDPGFKIKHRPYMIIYFLSIISIFILIIAWINYVNLSTARSLGRAKEVGLRKVAGATRGQLIKQFLFESVFFNVMGAIVAILIVKITTPTFNQILGLPLHVSLLSKTLFWLVLVISLAIGGFLSGLCPAFILSSFKPITVLQGKLKNHRSGVGLRKGLVVFQLLISIFFVTGTLTVYKQVDFMRNQELGINTDKVMIVRAPVVVRKYKNIRNNIRTFFSELEQFPEIASLTKGRVPGRSYGSSTGICREGGSKFMVNRIWMDYGFLKTFQIRLLAGRDFSPEITTDHTGAVILNETALKMLEFKSPGEAINQYIIDQDGMKKLKIIGIIKNYHQKCLRERIGPLILRISSHYGPSYYSFKLNTENFNEIISLIKKKWDKFLPGNPFEYTFLEDFYNLQYKIELKFGEIFRAFSLLAVFTACIGLFGLFAYATLQRTKEIGVRKVFGADVPTILGLLLKDLIKLLGISIFIAFPIAYFVFTKGLEFYAYRTGIGLWFFVIPLAIITPIIFITVAYHVVKAAMANPVDSLRYQ